MQRATDKAATRGRIRMRIRKKVTGTAARPRLAVFKSGRHIYVQAIDDSGGRTIAAASTLDEGVAAGPAAGSRTAGGGNIAAAKKVGAVIAERLKAIGCEAVVFDRGGYLYHGRVKALADAAREAGLRF